MAKFIATDIEDLYIIEPKIYNDQRGFFFESFNKEIFLKNGINIDFVQDNHSKSSKGVLRGIHYQIIKPQGKLVRVVSGSVYDVAVDLRSNSKTFGHWFGVELSAENKLQLWIPPGFGHAFLSLKDNTEFLYKTTEFYFPELDRSINPFDSRINIDWPQTEQIIQSSKDLLAPNLEQAAIL
jgi:dTDP-4-dehydrorhamnose 3,5-epimerase